jgi:hypothetical protein
VTGLTGGPQMPSAERRRLPTDSKSRQTRNLNPHPFPTGTTSRSATRRNLCSLAFHRPAMGEPFPSGTILGATTSRASDQHPKVEPTDRQTSSATRRTLSQLPELTPPDFQPVGSMSRALLCLASATKRAPRHSVTLRPSDNISDCQRSESACFPPVEHFGPSGLGKAVLPLPHKPRISRGGVHCGQAAVRAHWRATPARLASDTPTTEGSRQS